MLVPWAAVLIRREAKTVGKGNQMEIVWNELEQPWLESCQAGMNGNVQSARTRKGIVKGHNFRERNGQASMRLSTLRWNEQNRDRSKVGGLYNHPSK